jgi:hypothetical protein
MSLITPVRRHPQERLLVLLGALVIMAHLIESGGEGMGPVFVTVTLPGG